MSMRLPAKWLIASMLFVPCAAECKECDVDIPVEVQFANKEYRQEWIYRSLQPSIAALHEQYEPAREEVSQDSLLLTFCLPSRELERPAMNLLLTLASGKLKLALRPISWTGEGANRTGLMSTIRLLDQPDPDWNVVRSVRLISEASNTETLLEVTITNFGSIESTLNKLTLRASALPKLLGWSCLESTLHVQDVFLNLAQSAARSADRQSWTTLADRKVIVTMTLTSGCHRGASIRAEIPIQVSIPPKETARVTLRITSESSGDENSRLGVLDGRPQKAAPEENSNTWNSVDTRAWWRDWDVILVEFEPAAVFPSTALVRAGPASRELQKRPPLFRRLPPTLKQDDVHP